MLHDSEHGKYEFRTVSISKLSISSSTAERIVDKAINGFKCSQQRQQTCVFFAKLWKKIRHNFIMFKKL